MTKMMRIYLLRERNTRIDRLLHFLISLSLVGFAFFFVSIFFTDESFPFLTMYSIYNIYQPISLQVELPIC